MIRLMDFRPRMSGARSVIGVSVGWLGISMVADGLPALVLPYRMAGLGSSDATSLGLVTLLALSAAGFVQPLAGRFSDRYGRVRVLALGIASAMAGLALVALGQSLELVVVGFVVTMLGVGIAQAGQQPLLADHVSPIARGRASGAKNVFDVGGALLGFAVLAAFLGRGALAESTGALAVTLAVSCAAGLLLLKGARRHAAAQAAWAPAESPDMPPGIEQQLHARLVRLVVARFLFLLGVYVVGRYLFLFVAAAGGHSPEAAAELAGTLLVALAALTVVASMPAGWLTDLLGRRTLMLAGALIGSVGIATMALASGLGLMLAGGALLALGSAAFSAASWAALVDATAGADAGRLLGLANLGTVGAAAVAGTFGILIDLGSSFAPGAGFLVGFGLAAICAAIGGIVAWRSTPHTVAVRLGTRPATVVR